MSGHSRTSNLREGMNDLLNFLVSLQPKQAIHQSRRDQHIVRTKLLKPTKCPQGQLSIIAPKPNPNKKQPRGVTSRIALYKIQKVVTRAIVVTRLKHLGNFINIHQDRSASLTSDTDRERTQACSAPSSHPRRPAIEHRLAVTVSTRCATAPHQLVRLMPVLRTPYQDPPKPCTSDGLAQTAFPCRSPF